MIKVKQQTEKLHPWTGEPGWEVVTMTAETSVEIDNAINITAKDFWEIWFRGNDGDQNPVAVLYRPEGASKPWIDPIDGKTEV